MSERAIATLTPVRIVCPDCASNFLRENRASNPLAALTPAQLAAIRAVILEVIDDGAVSERRPWDFYVKGGWREDSAESNYDRMDFIDEVVRKIIERAKQ